MDPLNKLVKVKIYLLLDIVELHVKPTHTGELTKLDRLEFAPHKGRTNWKYDLIDT